MIDLKGTNRWLLASLAINLFLFGYVAAVLVGPRDDWPPPPPPPAMMLERMSENLSPEGQAVLRELIAENGAKLEGLQGAMIAARMRARDVFAQEPFDAAAFRAVSKEGFTAAQAFFDALGDVLSQAGARLSAEDRERLRPFSPPPPPR
ncbi:MAG TPA: periplasmic heavy metal sensor [Dongiaceae bacterium]|jgi:uncharacterized membrane protein|nr:periplasmic heavy metal sensor [Dongiaceae bacterium]